MGAKIYMQLFFNFKFKNKKTVKVEAIETVNDRLCRYEKIKANAQ